MILVDTSVWVNHLRFADERLTALLDAKEVLGHPFVIGEVALAHLRQREVTLRSLQRLPQAAVATDREVLRLIQAHPLHGRGIGYVDAHLLAAARLTVGARLWTADRRLEAVAAELDVAAILSY